MKSFLDFEEKNVEKAVQKACAELNIARDKLKYDIISYGSSGIFGLVGTKKALIRVFIPDIEKGKSDSLVTKKTENVTSPKDTSISQMEKDTVSALVDEAFGEMPAPAAAGSKKSKKSKKAAKPESVIKPEKKSSASIKEKITLTEKLETEKPAPADIDARLPENREAAIDVARNLAREIFKTMEVEAEMIVNSGSDPCWINVKVGEPGILIGKRGQTLEAIQYLVDKVVNKQCGKGNRVIFDVEGYVESRKTELKDLATRLASKTAKTGKPSTMTRMNAHDRRIVHVALKRNRSVRTQSVGDGYYRKLIIFPKKKSQRKADGSKSKK